MTVLKRDSFDRLRKVVTEKLKKGEPLHYELQLLLDMFDKRDLVSYELMNFILYLLSRGCSFLAIDSYKQCFFNLINIAPKSIDFQHKWMDKCFILLHNMKENSKKFSLDQLDELINAILYSQTCRKLFPLDLLKLLKISCFPIENCDECGGAYFGHWSALLAHNLATEIEEVEAEAHRQEKGARGDLFRIEDETAVQQIWTLNMRDATLILGHNDSIAFTILNNQKEATTMYNPIAFAQIVKQTGLIYEIYFFWPKEFVPDPKQAWRVDKFTSITPFRRQMQALKMHCKEPTQLSRFLIKSWYETSQVELQTDYEKLKQNLAVNQSCEFIYLTEGNEAQTEAVKFAKSSPITLVHGPPGTGKTEGK